MSRARTTGLLACLLTALVLVGPAAARAPGPSASAAARQHLQVVEIEYRLILSRGVVHAGPVSLQAIDSGMDPHDLRLAAEHGPGGTVSAPLLQPGQLWNRTVVLRPGLYRLWCALPEHARLGMRATLRVVR